jgi:glycosyltransferase involved in cell wall biosynthesis
MATYQGESWVDVQIATIVTQDSEDWRLLIRDDGSTDRTREIIRWWRDRFPDKIAILDEHNPQNLGLCGNFSALMSESSAPFAMFASWDDVWYRDKISSGVRAIRALESKHGSGVPLLVHTDLRMVDLNLHELQPRVLRYLGFVRSRHRIVSRFCLENTVWGCALVINKALLEMCNPIPSEARSEDWWFALTAAGLGVIEARDEVSIDWRRHGVNDSQLPTPLWKSIRNAVKSPWGYRQFLLSKIGENQKTVQVFLERFGDRLSTKDRDAVVAFLSLSSLGFWGRRRALLKNRIFYSSWIRTLGLLLLA